MPFGTAEKKNTSRTYGYNMGIGIGAYYRNNCIGFGIQIHLR